MYCIEDLFWVFMDLEIAHDTINPDGMSKILRVVGVGGKLLKAVQSFYVNSIGPVRIGMDVSERFPINVELTQGCVMSPWLF